MLQKSKKTQSESVSNKVFQCSNSSESWNRLNCKSLQRRRNRSDLQGQEIGRIHMCDSLQELRDIPWSQSMCHCRNFSPFWSKYHHRFYIHQFCTDRYLNGNRSILWHAHQNKTIAVVSRQALVTSWSSPFSSSHNTPRLCLHTLRARTKASGAKKNPSDEVTDNKDLHKENRGEKRL